MSNSTITSSNINTLPHHTNVLPISLDVSPAGWQQNLSVTVSPTSTSSTYLIIVHLCGSGAATAHTLGLLKNGSLIATPTSPGSRISSTSPGCSEASSYPVNNVIHYIDTAGTTSDITYSVGINRATGAGTYVVGKGSNASLTVFRIS